MKPAELHLPATQQQLRQFTGKLDLIIAEYVRSVDIFSSFEQQATIKLGDGGTFRTKLSFQVINPDQDEQYWVHTAHALPLTDEVGIQALTAQLLISRQEAQSASDEEGDVDVQDELELGYLEHESQLWLRKTPEDIEATMTAHVHVLDADYQRLGTEIVYQVGTHLDLLETEELQALPDGRQVAFRGRSAELHLSAPTAADLMMVMNGLVQCGFANKRMTAFKDASVYADQFMPAKIRSTEA